MKLLKILLIIFSVYFIRRFIQLYKAMKQNQKDQMKASAEAPRDQQKATPGGDVVDAEYKVIDP